MKRSERDKAALRTMTAAIRVKSDEQAVLMSEQLIQELGGVDAALAWFLELREHALKANKEHLSIRAWGWLLRLLEARESTGRQPTSDAEPVYWNDVDSEDVVEAAVQITVEAMATRASFCEAVLMAALSDHPEIRPAICRALEQTESA